MKILVLNCGSSSIKFQLIETDEQKRRQGNESRLAKGSVQKIGSAEAQIDFQAQGQKKISHTQPIYEHTTGIENILQRLVEPEKGVIKDVEEIEAVGHRVVHGGEYFSRSTIINREVEKGIRDCIELAPLHNPPNLWGYQATREVLPSVPQVAVFDTAFHQTMTPSAYIYGLPYCLYERYKIRRYGFHGTSHRYVLLRLAKILARPVKELDVITCHLGNGCSIASIKGGQSVDTSMGFTPLEGLVMGTRCGDIDPALVPFILEREDLRLEEVNNMLNKHSGLIGISGLSNDMRTLEDASKEGDQKAALAIDIFAYRVQKYIGAYLAGMNGADAIVFTAGIGENSPMVRERVCKNMDALGVEFDSRENARLQGKEGCISRESSPVKVFVIPTDEELLIARDTYQCVTEKSG